MKPLSPLVVDVDSLFIFAPIVCGNCIFGPCFVMHYLVSSIALQSFRWEPESWLLKLTVCGCYCSVCLLQGIVGCSAVIVVILTFLVCFVTTGEYDMIVSL